MLAGDAYGAEKGVESKNPECGKEFSGVGDPIWRCQTPGSDAFINGRLLKSKIFGKMLFTFYSHPHGSVAALKLPNQTSL